MNKKTIDSIKLFLKVLFKFKYNNITNNNDFLHFLNFFADTREKCKISGHANRYQNEMDIWIQVAFQLVHIPLPMKIQMLIYIIG